VDGSVLPDDGPGINRNNLSSRERLGYPHKCFPVVLRQTIDRTDDSPVDNKEVGIGCWQPLPSLLPFLLIDEIVRPVSLALRLYGNIYGEESVTEQIYELLPIGAPLIMMILSLLFCTLQAIIFTTLTAIYTDESTALEE
jgi:hypothetical protein